MIILKKKFWSTDIEYSRFKQKFKLFVFKGTVNVLCFWGSKLLKFLDYKFMLKLQCKTIFNSAFVGKNFNEI
jgi:hypothetical protein